MRVRGATVAGGGAEAPRDDPSDGNLRLRFGRFPQEEPNN